MSDDNKYVGCKYFMVRSEPGEEVITHVGRKEKNNPTIIKGKKKNTHQQNRWAEERDRED